MKNKIEHFNIQNCNFHEYKNELFILNEDKEQTPFSLISKFITEREKDKEGTSLIFEDLFKTIDPDVIQDIRKVINSDLLYYKRLSKASALKITKNPVPVLNSLLSLPTESSGRPLKTYSDFYEQYKETLLFTCVQRYFTDKEDFYLKHLISSSSNLVSEYHLDFMFLHAFKKGIELPTFTKFLNKYFTNEDMHILNMHKEECSFERIIKEMDDESLKNHLVNKKVNLNKDLSEILKHSYSDSKVLIIMDAMLKYNSSLSPIEVSYINEVHAKYEKELIKKIIVKNEDKNHKKRL